MISVLSDGDSFSECKIGGLRAVRDCLAAAGANSETRTSAWNLVHHLISRRATPQALDFMTEFLKVQRLWHSNVARVLIFCIFPCSPVRAVSIPSTQLKSPISALSLTSSRRSTTSSLFPKCRSQIWRSWPLSSTRKSLFVTNGTVSTHICPLIQHRNDSSNESTL